jgi:hypothetical protein
MVLDDTVSSHALIAGIKKNMYFFKLLENSFFFQYWML